MSKNDVSHFYRLLPSGVVESAYGASIKEAREGKLYASATMALKMVANVGLDIWIRGNLLDAVVNNPRGPVESVEQYKERIANLSEVKRTDAADFGTALHNALEHYPLPCNDENVSSHYEACLPWLKTNVAGIIGNELMMADRDIGFAGKTDMVFYNHAGEPVVCDYKSCTFKKTKTGKWAKPAFYQSWVRQLAFYARCYQKKHGGPLPRVVSLAINSGEPCEPVAKWWTVEEQEQGMNEFLCAAYLYSCDRDHWPAGLWELKEQRGGVHVAPSDESVTVDVNFV